MQFNEPVHEAIFLKRYKRFFADVRLENEIWVAHVPNTGSLKTCIFPESPCVITKSLNPNRKLKATLQFLKTPTSWVGVNTALPNEMVYELWQGKLLNHWIKYGAVKREFKISKETRFDMAMAKTAKQLEAQEDLHFVEVKNVTMAEEGVARFPDAVTTRGQKHLEELMRLLKKGHKSELVFVVQRSDCEVFAPADDIDPVYGKLLRQAIDAGVSVNAFACEIEIKKGVSIKPTPLKLKL